jgi:hypothetical protein
MGASWRFRSSLLLASVAAYTKIEKDIGVGHRGEASVSTIVTNAPRSLLEVTGLLTGGTIEFAGRHADAAALTHLRLAGGVALGVAFVYTA